MTHEDKRNGIIENGVYSGNFGPYLDNPFSNTQRVEMVGKNLAFLRREADLSQKEVCDIIGVAPQTYSGYEKGKHEPTIETLVRLSHLYNVTLDFIAEKNEGLGDGDENDYVENIIENPTFKDLQIEVYQMREEMKRIRQQIKEQK